MLRELAKSMDLDAEKLINDDREAYLQAEIIKAAGAGMQAQQPQNVPGINPQDPSGGGAGNIGVGSAPLPEEQGFSGVPRQTPETPPDFGGMQ